MITNLFAPYRPEDIFHYWKTRNHVEQFEAQRDQGGIQSEHLPSYFQPWDLVVLERAPELIQKYLKMILEQLPVAMLVHVGKGRLTGCFFNAEVVLIPGRAPESFLYITETSTLGQLAEQHGDHMGPATE